MTTTKQELLQVKLEFGHKASCKNQPTQDGFTHDWTVFVRGQDGKDISHFVEKVVFNLHDSFPKPKRVIKEPPYKIDEQGYGSFILPIDVYFRNKEQPKSVSIEYDLFLPAKGSPAIHNKRTEALKFLNPPEEFKKKVLKSGGEMLSSSNGSSSSPPVSNQPNVNGNTGHNHSFNNGKEMKEPATNGETEKPKKPKPEKLVSKTSNTGNKTSSQSTTSLSGKRPSDDDEVLPKVKKKKKKLVESKEGQQSQSNNTKPTGFIPIEPPVCGTVEEHMLGSNKDVKLKIKSLSKTLKKGVKTTDKATEKSTEKAVDKACDKAVNKVKEKKKVKQNNAVDSSSSVTNVHSNSINGNGETKKKSSTISKSKEKQSKSPKESKSKTSKQEERKVEKLMFRRESGDSWSSSTSSNSPSLQMLNSSSYNKTNPLGTLMAELSDQDDDDDEDIDISTPFQTDSLTPKSDSFPLSNNNVLSTKDSKPSKAKTKTKEKKESKSSSSKNGAVKSPTISSKTESSKSSTKISSKTKVKTTKNGSNGHRVSRTDLLNLYKELSSITDSDRLQQVADIIEPSSCFVVTETDLEFDLNILDISTIQRIQKCIKR